MLQHADSAAANSGQRLPSVFVAQCLMAQLLDRPIERLQFPVVVQFELVAWSYFMKKRFRMMPSQDPTSARLGCGCRHRRCKGSSSVLSSKDCSLPPSRTSSGVALKTAGCALNPKPKTLNPKQSIAGSTKPPLGRPRSAGLIGPMGFCGSGFRDLGPKVQGWGLGFRAYRVYLEDHGTWQLSKFISI